MASAMRLELIQVPVSDIDRAKEFYVEKVGFIADHDHQVSDELRFVQLTPPGSACSIALTSGAHQMAPGSLDGLQMVVDDAEEPQRVGRARRRRQRCPGIPVGKLRLLQGPGRQRLGAPGDDPPRLAVLLYLPHSSGAGGSNQERISTGPPPRRDCSIASSTSTTCAACSALMR